MNRRRFIFLANSFILGNFFGLGNFSKAFALQGQKNSLSSQPKIALIIDDIGYSVSRAERFLESEIPITFSILPRLKYSNELALYINKEGHDIMLHQPMEPYNSKIDPGPGALYVGDRLEKVTKVLEENIKSIPFATGVNNHMGSRFTECEQEMNQALSVIRNKGLFFIDSLTSSHSIAYSTAKKLHMITAFRNIFLDNDRDITNITRQLKRLEMHARNYGRAIAIGHPHVETALAIKRFFKQHAETNCTLVHVSDIFQA